MLIFYMTEKDFRDEEKFKKFKAYIKKSLDNKEDFMILPDTTRCEVVETTNMLKLLTE